MVLVAQGDAGDEVYLVLDGVLGVEVDGERLAEYGPGAILGERADLEGGTRTSTLVAVTPCKVASVHADQLDRSQLEELSEGHRREDTSPASPCASTSAACAGPRPRRAAEFVRYGGFTSCVALAHDGDDAPTLLLDAGTGHAPGHRAPRRRPFSGTILLSHLHWDHTHGLPFFKAATATTRASSCAPRPARRSSPARDVLARGMSPPHFPIRPEGLRGTWRFHGLVPGDFEVEGFTSPRSRCPTRAAAPSATA